MIESGISDKIWKYEYFFFQKWEIFENISKLSDFPIIFGILENIWDFLECS